MNQAYRYYAKEKKQGKIVYTWDIWVQVNVNMADSYERKIRRAARILGPYPGFKKITLSFDQIYSRMDDIEEMLTSEASADYLRQP